MLDDLAVLDAEDVDSSLAAICIIEGNVVVDEDEVAIRADVLDFRLALREFLEEALNAILECLTAILEARIVLDVVRSGHLVDHGRVVFAENPELTIGEIIKLV